MKLNAIVTSVLGLALSASVSGVPPADAATIFASGSSNINTPIYTIDTTTGAQTLLGNSGFSNVQSLAFSPTGVLYGTTFGGGGSNMRLLTVDQTTGAATVVTPITPAPGTNSLNASTGLAFDSSGNMYLIGRDFNQTGSLYTLNPSTGVVTSIGSTNAIQTQDMAIASNGTAFALNIGNAGTPASLTTRGVRSLDLATGNTTFLGEPVGGSTVQLTSMTFTPDGTLWVGGAGFLYTADTTTGALTQQYSGLATYHGLAALAPVPVPAAVWLFGSGLAAMAGFARRKLAA